MGSLFELELELELFWGCYVLFCFVSCLFLCLVIVTFVTFVICFGCCLNVRTQPILLF